MGQPHILSTRYVLDFWGKKRFFGVKPIVSNISVSAKCSFIALSNLLAWNWMFLRWTEKVDIFPKWWFSMGRIESRHIYLKQIQVNVAETSRTQKSMWVCIFNVYVQIHLLYGIYACKLLFWWSPLPYPGTRTKLMSYFATMDWWEEYFQPNGILTTIKTITKSTFRSARFHNPTVSRPLCGIILWTRKAHNQKRSIWVFPKIVVPPNHQF